MDILACLDKNYLMACGIMMTSVCINNAEEDITFHLIVDDSITSKDEMLLNDILQNKTFSGGVKVKFYRFNDMCLAEFKNGLGLHLTLATYYRLFITSLLPSTVSRVIYLDGDLIVRKSLKEMWELDLTGKAIAGVPDMSEALPERYERLGYSQELGYFNAGVLVINLDYWREHNMEKVFFDYMQANRDKLLQHDQDVLNYTCLNVKVTLPLKYNCQDGFYYNRCYFDRKKYADQLEEALIAPVILHYTAHKPWEQKCDHPYVEEFFKYQRLTSWKDIPLSTPKHPLTFKQQLVRVLRALHLIAPRYRKLHKTLQ